MVEAVDAAPASSACRSRASMRLRVAEPEGAARSRRHRRPRRAAPDRALVDRRGLVSIRHSPGWFADPAHVPGGAFIDEGIYWIDCFRWLTGSEVVEVDARMANLVHKDLAVEDWGLAMFTFANGVRATLEAAWTINAPRDDRARRRSRTASSGSKLIGTRGEITDQWFRAPGRAVLAAGADDWVFERQSEEPFAPPIADAARSPDCLRRRTDAAGRDDPRRAHVVRRGAGGVRIGTRRATRTLARRTLTHAARVPCSILSRALVRRGRHADPPSDQSGHARAPDAAGARAKVTPLAAIERLVGMQAQWPKPPFIGLWSRLEGFERDAARGAFTVAHVVRATFMRATIHVVTAKDFLALRPAIQPVLEAAMQAILKERLDGIDLDALTKQAREMLGDEPLTFEAIRDEFLRADPEGRRARDGLRRAHAAAARAGAGRRMQAWAFPSQACFAPAEQWLDKADSHQVRAA